MKKLVCMVMLLTSTVHCHKKLTYTSLTEAAIKEIRSHDGQPVTITLTGPQTVLDKCSSYVQGTAAFLHSISLQNILLKGAASLVGATALSYGFIAYSIYRVYKLIGKMSSWLAWNAEVHEHDMVEEAKQYLARSLEQEPIKRSGFGDRHGNCLKALKEEETLIRLYLSLNRILKKYKIRAFFTYDEYKEKQLEHALQMLTTATDMCKI